MLETVYDDDKLKMLMDDFKLRPEKGNQKLKNGRRKGQKIFGKRWYQATSNWDSNWISTRLLRTDRDGLEEYLRDMQQIIHEQKEFFRYKL